MPPISNKIFSFESASGGTKTKVNVQSAHGLKAGMNIEIMDSENYVGLGPWTISNIQPGSFEIDFPYVAEVINKQIWQISRTRPTIVNPEGENIDSLRQAVNQISSDLGNKLNISPDVANRKDIVNSINSLLQAVKDERLRNIIFSIATN